MKEKLKYFILIIFIFLSNKDIVAQHFNDSTTNILKTWTLPELFDSEHFTVDDSTLENFQIYKIYEKKFISTSQLGNIGSAYISNHFFSRPDAFTSNFAFNNPYFEYLQKPENVTFYNTRKPYTKFFYAGSSKLLDEQSMEFIHTQNVNPNLNISVNYNLISSKGQYINQSNKLNIIGLTTNYTKRRITTHAAFNYNKFKLENNGGIVDDGIFDISSLQSYLTKAYTIINNTDFLLSNKYSFGKYEKIRVKDTSVNVVMPTVSFNYAFLLEKKYRVYQDIESFEKGYYQNFYYAKDLTYDSIAMYSYSNIFRFSSESVFEKKYNLGFNVAIQNSILHYYNFNNYIVLNNKNNFIQNKLSGDLFYLLKQKNTFKILGTYFFTGYRQNDLRTGFEYKRRLGAAHKPMIIGFNAFYSSRKPDYFITKYYSNHFRWDNDFKNSNTIDLSLDYKYPKAHIDFKANYALLSNYTYFGPVALPMQYENRINIYSLQLAKSINFGKIHFFNKVVWQKSSNETIIDIPEFIVFNSTSIEFNYKSALKIYIGFDINYTTKYQALSFNPAVGNFYFENTETTGNYPFGSIYINAKIKSNVMIFTKLEHANSGIFIQKYEAVNNYPINKRMFIIGLRWLFNN